MTASFYVEVLGLEVGMEDPVLGLSSPANPKAQVIIPPPGMEEPQPRFGVDVDDPAAVDAAREQALRHGLRVVYPLPDARGAFAASSSRTPAARSSTCSRTPTDR
jgi:catechol 2,3-dioxygenase-like lactoylglutathione lyase family enzyme